MAKINYILTNDKLEKLGESTDFDALIVKADSEMNGYVMSEADYNASLAQPLAYYTTML